jgi:hypothetical protein
LTLPQKIIFTVVFTVYWFVFYGIVRFTLLWFDPSLLEIPDRLTQTYLWTVLAVFTGIVAMAYLGASAVVLGHLPGRQNQTPRDSGRKPRRRRSGAGR